MKDESAGDVVEPPPTQLEITVDRDVGSTDSGLGSSNGESNSSCVADPDCYHSNPAGEPEKQEGSNKWLEISPKEDADPIAPPNAAPSMESSLPRDISSQDLASWQQNNLAAIAQINAEDCGTPLPLFTKVSELYPKVTMCYL